MSKQEQYPSEFGAKAALDTLKGEQTVVWLASRFGVRSKMIHIRPNGAADILCQRLGTDRYEQVTHCCIEASVYQSVEQRLHDRLVLRRACDHAQRGLAAIGFNPDCIEHRRLSSMSSRSIWITRRSSADRPEAIHSYRRG